MRRIYIAGPYSSAPEVNVRKALEAATALLDAGLSPYVPHLTHYWHAAFPRDYSRWMALDLEWLSISHGLLRLPGESPGADREEQEARYLGIPVFGSVEAVLQVCR